MPSRIYDAFDSIKASEELKSATRRKIKTEVEKNGKAVFSAGRALAVCAVLCLILGLGGWYGVSSYPVSYVSIDVNPSIELCLNCWNKVIRASAYNEDGRKILDTVSVKGMYLEDAIDAIVESEAMTPYLDKDEELIFTVAAGSSQKEGRINEAINQSDSCQNHNTSSCSVGIDSVQEAHANGMSFGKYAAYLRLCEYDDSVTVDECRDMTMSKLHRLVREHEEEHNMGDQGHGAQHGHHGE